MQIDSSLLYIAKRNSADNWWVYFELIMNECFMATQALMFLPVNGERYYHTKNIMQFCKVKVLIKGSLCECLKLLLKCKNYK